MKQGNVTLTLNKDKEDKVFSQAESAIGDFSFNSKVADVFDDMVSRSVPYYEEMQRQVCELAKDFTVANTSLYDIGCSTATTLLALDECIDPTVKFVGIDNAPEMLAKAHSKVDASGSKRQFHLIPADLHHTMQIENASVVTMILTLQFVRPLYREKVMQSIYSGLNDKGCLILIEKLTSEETIFNRLFINHYYDFKRRNGYSDIEIAKKREALENVLIPYRLEENIALLKDAGFKSTEIFFRWYNFCGIIAIK